MYSAGIALGTEDDWNFLWNKFLVETDASEKELYSNALAQTTQLLILNRYSVDYLTVSLQLKEDIDILI